MIVYHFTIHATECSERVDRYFGRKKDAIVACMEDAAILAKEDPERIGDTIPICRSELVNLPKRELVLRCLNRRAFLSGSVNTTEVANIKVNAP